MYIESKSPQGGSSHCHPKLKRFGVHCRLRSAFRIQCLASREFYQFILNCCFVRGHGQLHWTLGDPRRSNSSEGVNVERCDSGHHPHSHCSKLTVPHLRASDTGTYICKYSKDGSDHITSTYVYVKGKICKSLGPVQSLFSINYSGTSGKKKR